jgi:hypothetical protein
MPEFNLGASMTVDWLGNFFSTERFTLTNFIFVSDAWDIAWSIASAVDWDILSLLFRYISWAVHKG